MLTKSYQTIVLAFVFLILFYSTNTLLASSAHADEETTRWLLSQHEFRSLVLAPDPSAAEWSGAKMISVQTDRGGVALMSVHNDTYFLILTQTEIDNVPANLVGLAIDFNRSAVVWSWVGGSLDVVNDTHVQSTFGSSSNLLTVVFGRPIHSAGAGVRIEDNTPYTDFLRVAFWTNGTGLRGISFEGAPVIGFELLPYINEFPSLPIIYAGTIVVGGLGFILLEMRKYGRGDG